MITLEQLKQGLPVVLMKHAHAVVEASAVGGAVVIEAPDTAVNFASCSVYVMDVAELAALLGVRDIDFAGAGAGEVARCREENHYPVVLIAAGRVRLVPVSDADLQRFVDDVAAALCAVP